MANDKSTVKSLTKYSYGAGHNMNDMCSAMWITYMLLFHMNVIEINPIDAGIIVLAGQIVDGIATILVGILIDMDASFRPCIIYGTKKVYDV